MQTQTLMAILNMAQAPQYYTDNEEKAKRLVADLQALCRIESEAEQARLTKFNIYNYVSKDKGRPNMCGVYHCNGRKVASDLSILVVLEEHYADNLEGKIMLKNGRSVEEEFGYTSPYPKYESVFSTKEPESVIKIDFNSLPSVFNKAKMNMKINKVEQCVEFIVPKDGQDTSIYFKCDSFKKLVEFMKYIGTDEIKMYPSTHRIEVASNKGKGVLMGVRISHKDEDNIHEIKYLKVR